MWWVITVVAVVVLVATYLTWLAARVDRLHARAVAAYATLDAHLLRRAVAAVALAEAAQLPTLMYAARIALDAGPDDREVAENDLTRHLRDAAGSPAASAAGGPEGLPGGGPQGLAGAEAGSLAADGGPQDAPASGGPEDLADAVAGPPAAVAGRPAADGGQQEVLGALVQVSRRVALARQVHNDVVRDALAVRRRLLVRLFRLARKHPRPAYFDVDDPSLP